MVPENLKSNNFFEYATALMALKPNDCKTIDNDDLVIILRVYYWYLKAAGFQDIYDISTKMYKIIEKCKDKGAIDADGYDYNAIKDFILEFVNNGNYAGSASNVIYSINEFKVIIRNTVSEDEYSVVEQYIALFKKMEDLQHNCYYLLRDIIREEHLDFLYELIITLEPEHQSFILRALDKFEGNLKVIGFFKKIISNTDNEYFKEEIEGYLNRIRILEK